MNVHRVMATPLLASVVSFSAIAQVPKSSD